MMQWILKYKIKVSVFLPEMFCIVVCELSFAHLYMTFNT